LKRLLGLAQRVLGLSQRLFRLGNRGRQGIRPVNFISFHGANGGWECIDLTIDFKTLLVEVSDGQGLFEPIGRVSGGPCLTQRGSALWQLVTLSLQLSVGALLSASCTSSLVQLTVQALGELDASKTRGFPDGAKVDTPSQRLAKAARELLLIGFIGREQALRAQPVTVQGFGCWQRRWLGSLSIQAPVDLGAGAIRPPVIIALVELGGNGDG